MNQEALTAGFRVFSTVVANVARKSVICSLVLCLCDAVKWLLMGVPQLVRTVHDEVPTFFEIPPTWWGWLSAALHCALAAPAIYFHCRLFHRLYQYNEGRFGKEFGLYNMISVAFFSLVLQIFLDGDSALYASVWILSISLSLCWALAWHKHLPFHFWDGERERILCAVGILALIIFRDGKAVAFSLFSSIGVCIYCDRRWASLTNNAVYLAARFHRLNHIGEKGGRVPHSPKLNEMLRNWTRLLIRSIMAVAWFDLILLKSYVVVRLVCITTSCLAEMGKMCLAKMK